MRASPSDGDDPSAASGAARTGAGRAALICGLTCLVVALLALVLYLGLIPGGTSGESMLLLVFVALPLAIVSVSLGASRRGPGGRSAMARAGLALGIVVALVILLVLLAVYIGWRSCAGSCI